MAANLAAAALGTETDGSIVAPASAAALVGIKPTAGITSRSGVIPVAFSQDSVGPLARSVADAALILSTIVCSDPTDVRAPYRTPSVTPDYTAYLELDGLRGARIGVPRKFYFGFNRLLDAAIEVAIAVMSSQGAVIIDPAEIPTAEQMRFDDIERTVMLYEFKAGLSDYLHDIGGDVPVRTLEGVITFNEQHRQEELAFFGQDLFEQAQAKGDLSEPEYIEALGRSRLLSRDAGIDAVFG